MARFHVNQDGWTQGCERRPSPFYNERPDGALVSLAVVHFISLPAGQFGTGDPDRLFTGCLDCSQRPEYADLRGLEVSSHFVIDRRGHVRQYVSTESRAWHAGVSVFEGRAGCNDYSVGIELEGCGEVPFEKAQYRALLSLLRALRRRYPILAVTGHEHIAPGRKQDPGPYFDWQRLRQALPASLRIVTKPQKTPQ